MYTARPGAINRAPFLPLSTATAKTSKTGRCTWHSFNHVTVFEGHEVGNPLTKKSGVASTETMKKAVGRGPGNGSLRKGLAENFEG